MQLLDKDPSNRPNASEALSMLDMLNTSQAGVEIAGRPQSQSIPNRDRPYLPDHVFDRRDPGELILLEALMQAAGFTILAGMFVVIAVFSGEGEPFLPIGPIVLASGAAFGVAKGIFDGVNKIRRNAWKLIISSTGIATSDGIRIEWSDIESVYVGLGLLQVILRDPSSFLPRFETGNVNRISYKRDLKGFRIDLTVRDAGYPTILKAIQEHCPDLAIREKPFNVFKRTAKR